MFFSSSVDLKLHTYSDTHLETHPVKSPPSMTRIRKVSVSSDDTFVAVLHEDQKPQIFSIQDLNNIRLVHTVNVSNVTAITFKRKTKKNITLGTKCGEIIIYDTGSRSISKVSKVGGSVNDLKYTCDDQSLCGIYTNNLFACTDFNTCHLKSYEQISECTSLKCHPRISNRAVIGCRNGNVGIWDIEEGKELMQIDVLQTPVFALGLSTCGKYLFVAGKNVKVCGIDDETRTCTYQHDFEEEKPVMALDVSSDDKYLAVGLVDGVVKLYNLDDDLQEVLWCKAHDFAINVIVFQNKTKEVTGSVAGDCPKNAVFEEFTKDTIETINAEMDTFEGKMEQCCKSYQKLFDHEFEGFNSTFNETWGVFNSGNATQIMLALSSQRPASSRE